MYICITLPLSCWQQQSNAEVILSILFSNISNTSKGNSSYIVCAVFEWNWHDGSRGNSISFIHSYIYISYPYLEINLYRVLFIEMPDCDSWIVLYGFALSLSFSVDIKRNPFKSLSTQFNSIQLNLSINRRISFHLYWIIILSVYIEKCILTYNIIRQRMSVLRLCVISPYSSIDSKWLPFRN